MFHPWLRPHFLIKIWVSAISSSRLVNRNLQVGCVKQEGYYDEHEYPKEKKTEAETMRKYQIGGHKDII